MLKKPAHAFALVALTACIPISVATIADAAPPKDYPNCTALNKVYPHGVGKFGARDKTTGVPVTNFKRNNRVYRLNNESDRDNDMIACEKL